MLQEVDGLALGDCAVIIMAGTMHVARALRSGRTVVAVLCDLAAQYAGKLYLPVFLRSRVACRHRLSLGLVAVFLIVQTMTESRYLIVYQIMPINYCDIWYFFIACPDALAILPVQYICQYMS